MNAFIFVKASFITATHVPLFTILILDKRVGKKEKKNEEEERDNHKNKVDTKLVNLTIVKNKYEC